MSDKTEITTSQEYSPPHKPQHKQKPQQPKKPLKYHLKIVYEDSTKTIAQVVLEIKDYELAYDHAGNVERCMEEIYEVGGFWLNTTTMIPYSKIYSISTHIVREEPENHPKQQDRRLNRGNRHRGNKPQQKVEKIENKKPNSPPSPGILNLS